MKDHALTQTKLAERVKSSQPVMSRMIRSREPFRDLDLLIKICETLAVGDYKQYLENHDSALALDNRSNIRYTDWTNSFKWFINPRLEGFVGREFVFQEIQGFFDSKDRGYFTVVGDPGDGKSAIAANYLNQNPKQNSFFFNIRSGGHNTTSSFLESTCQQLIKRYGLSLKPQPDRDWTDGSFMQRVLAGAEAKLDHDNKLILVVDALDEADLTQQKEYTNPLYLPQAIPKNIYFLLTRRRDKSLEERLRFDSPSKTLDLKNPRHQSDVMQDVAKYIKNYIAADSDGSELQQQINKFGLALDDFCLKLYEKSQGNFMYLTLVLPEIAVGSYQDLDTIDHLPTGLINYYNEHWNLMKMDENPFKIYVIATLAKVYRPVPLQEVVRYVSQAATDVTERMVIRALEGWWQFLHCEQNGQEFCYQIYHESFRDYLFNGKAEVASACREVGNWIADSLISRDPRKRKSLPPS
ncbi:MAG: helix-turn-helix domain-containing protein [Leptolyngbyaceae cyanobacterium SL_5_9]|nr:helix-turn-helix domain-containing protein [Leptolyngbyaceae cyanobacterium SL_5_9]